MNNPTLGFNYLVVAIASTVLVSMLIYALLAKMVHDVIVSRHAALLKQFLDEVETLIRPRSLQTGPSFEDRLEEYYRKNGRLLRSGKERDIFEEALLQTINRTEALAGEARQIAYRFSFADESMTNLKSGNATRRLRGCQQAGAYLCEAAIPLLLEMLHYMDPQLQYNALLALANFKKPELVVQSFMTIKNAILVNDRTVREIVGKMDDKKPQLFHEILQTNSYGLVSIFLKYIDKESANLYLDEIKELTTSDDMEIRISAIRALSETRSERALSALIEALGDEAWEVRAAAAKGLRNIPGSQAYLPLVRAMGDEAWWVRQNAAASALSLPRPELLVRKVLRSHDQYAIDALFHAAELMNMTHIILDVQEQDNQEKTTHLDRKVRVALA